MRKIKDDLTKSYVRSLYLYIPSTGILLHRTSKGGVKIGSQVGGIIRKGGRCLLSIGGFRYLASRIIWLYMTGHWPREEIDHKNRDVNDNRWTNLREATRAQNGANRSIKSKHGYKGVHRQSFAPGRTIFRYYAKIGVKGKDIYIGRFNTPEEAAKAYDAAALKYYGKFAFFNFGVPHEI